MLRKNVVRAVRSGQSQRSVARQFNVSEKFVRYWCKQTGMKYLMISFFVTIIH
ncbi:MAG: helix-turn-helix domain containing protein [Planctomycetaceae bacterium]|nr:helix-turn-helix domain containing protein [Planctomycetaceae bacterium]